MHPEALEWCSRFAHDHPGHALDVGGRDVNGTARHLWPNMQWTVLDLHGDPGNHLDRVIEADIRRWEPDQSYDLVLSTELFEHLRHWWLGLGTMEQARSDTGLLVLTCAGPGREPHPMHGAGPEDLLPDEWYQNVDPASLRFYLEAFLGNEIFVVDVLGNDVRAVVQPL